MRKPESQAADYLTEPPSGVGNRRQRLLLLGLMFVAGGVVGGSLTAWKVKRDFADELRHPERFADHIVSSLNSRLGLNNDQRAQIDQIVREQHQRVEQLRREFHPRLLNEIERMEAEIEKVITPEQKPSWEKWRQEMRERFPQQSPNTLDR